ncbi:hypothetical protein VTN96DRAFT_6962 [Rasamsonia emersonii]
MLRCRRSRELAPRHVTFSPYSSQINVNDTASSRAAAQHTSVSYSCPESSAKPRKNFHTRQVDYPAQSFQTAATVIMSIALRWQWRPASLVGGKSPSAR